MAKGALRGNALTGILLMIAGVSLIPVSDTVTKYLTATYPVMQVIWMRYAAQCVIVAILFSLFGRWSLARTARPGLQALRGLFTLVSSIFFVSGLTYLPLVQAIAITFANPLFVVAFSVPLLGERVGIHRWSAVCIGFAGILVIMRPNLDTEWATLLPLGSAVFGSLFQIATRALAATDHALTTFLYFNLFGAVALSPILVSVWIEPSFVDWLWFAAVGLIYGAASYLIIKAFDHADASALAPFFYTQIVSATVMGFLVFGDLPDTWTVAGLVIVIGAGLYVVHRERQRRAPRPERA
ncbi:MAG: DMT family transporter [Alphaproteobacteria bacterium]